MPPFHPGHADTLYAGWWEARVAAVAQHVARARRAAVPCEAGMALNPGEELNGNKEGLRGGIIWKIGVSVSLANPVPRWAMTEHRVSGVFRTDEGWRRGGRSTTKASSGSGRPPPVPYVDRRGLRIAPNDADPCAGANDGADHGELQNT